jgi:hypothetical protein
MAALPHFLLVFDISAILGSGEREWREFARIGECLVPRAVLEELQLLCDRSTESAHEQTARAFFRFFPDSSWKPTFSIASHPSLKPSEGHALSKKARLGLTVAQNAYGLARNRPDGLVVLVANDQGVMQRTRDLGINNLCAIPLVALVQWSRTERKPPVVLRQVQTLRSGLREATPVGAAKVNRPSPTVQPTPTESHWSTSRRSRRPILYIPVTRIFYNLLTLGIVAGAVLTLWHFVFPNSFAQFWRQLPQVGHPLRN